MINEIRKRWAKAPYPYAWYWRKNLPERKGQPCRVLVRGKMNTILVEFEDGFKTTASRYAVRLRKPKPLKKAR